MTTLWFVLRRLAQAVVVVWAAWTFSFIILFLLPGDPALNLVAGGDMGQIVDEDELARVRAQHGLDQPFIVQYATRLLAALRGDLGVSMITGRPVTDIIGEGLPSTLMVIGGALLIGSIVGALLALVATFVRTGWLRGVLLALPPFGISLPTFWVGLMLIQFFSFQLRVLPPTGNAGFASLVMPWLTLALPTAATVGQVLAKSLATVQGEAFVTTARAIGMRRAVIHFRDIFRNAAIPAVTIAGVVVASLLGGAIVIENVFSRTGIGRATVQAVLGRDIAVVQGVVVFGAVLFVLVSLIVDLIYPLIDPRLRSTLKGGDR